MLKIGNKTAKSVKVGLLTVSSIWAGKQKIYPGNVSITEETIYSDWIYTNGQRSRVAKVYTITVFQNGHVDRVFKNTYQDTETSTSTNYGEWSYTWVLTGTSTRSRSITDVYVDGATYTQASPQVETGGERVVAFTLPLGDIPAEGGSVTLKSLSYNYWDTTLVGTNSLYGVAITVSNGFTSSVNGNIVTVSRGNNTTNVIQKARIVGTKAGFTNSTTYVDVYQAAGVPSFTVSNLIGIDNPSGIGTNYLRADGAHSGIRFQADANLYWNGVHYDTHAGIRVYFTSVTNGFQIGDPSIGWGVDGLFRLVNNTTTDVISGVASGYLGSKWGNIDIPDITIYQAAGVMTQAMTTTRIFTGVKNHPASGSYADIDGNLATYWNGINTANHQVNYQSFRTPDGYDGFTISGHRISSASRGTTVGVAIGYWFYPNYNGMEGPRIDIYQDANSETIIPELYDSTYYYDCNGSSSRPYRSYRDKHTWTSGAGPIYSNIWKGDVGVWGYRDGICGYNPPPKKTMIISFSPSQTNAGFACNNSTYSLSGGNTTITVKSTDGVYIIENVRVEGLSGLNFTVDACGPPFSKLEQLSPRAVRITTTYDSSCAVIRL